MESYMDCYWIESAVQMMALSVSLLSHFWARIFFFTAVITGFVHWTFYRPKMFYRDLTGTKGDSYFNVNSSATMAGQRFSKRILKENQSVLKSTPIYANGWNFLCFSDAVKVRGVKYVEALGEDFAVFRTSTGKIHVVDAYCPHLGANMGVGGIVKDDCLQCPFHGWRFDGETGKCKNIPYTKKVPEFAKVKTWKSCEVNQMIFVWYHAEGKEPHYEIPPIDEIMSGRYRLTTRCEHLTHANVKDFFEGLADLQHSVPVHIPEWTRDKRFVADKRFSLVPFIKGHATLSWKADSTKPHEALAQICSTFSLFGKIKLLTIKPTLKMIGPSYVHTEFDFQTPIQFLKVRIISITVNTPVGPTITRSCNVAYCRPLFMPGARLFFTGFIDNFENDLMLYNYKKVDPKVIISEGEDDLVQCKRWWKQFFSEKSTCLKVERDVLSW